jgi:hypothetical protein
LVFFEWPSAIIESKHKKKEGLGFIKALIQKIKDEYKPVSITLTGKQFDAELFMCLEEEKDNPLNLINICSEFGRSKSLLLSKENMELISSSDTKNAHIKMMPKTLVKAICEHIPKTSQFQSVEWGLNRDAFIKKVSECLKPDVLQQVIDIWEETSKNERDRFFIYEYISNTKTKEKKELRINKLCLIQKEVSKVYEKIYAKNAKEIGDLGVNYFQKLNYGDDPRISLFTTLKEASTKTMNDTAFDGEFDSLNERIPEVLKKGIYQLTTEYLLVCSEGTLLRLDDYLIQCSKKISDMSISEPDNAPMSQIQ